MWNYILDSGSAGARIVVWENIHPPKVLGGEGGTIPRQSGRGVGGSLLWMR